MTLQAVADGCLPGTEPQQVLYLEGLALSALGRYSDAVEALSQAAKRNAPTTDILCRLSEAELLSGRVNEAQITVQQALAIDPNFPLARELATKIATAQIPSQTLRR